MRGRGRTGKGGWRKREIRKGEGRERKKQIEGKDGGKPAQKEGRKERGIKKRRSR